MGPLEDSDLIRLNQKEIVVEATFGINNSDETWEDAGIHRTSQIKTCWKSLKASNGTSVIDGLLAAQMRV